MPLFFRCDRDSSLMFKFKPSKKAQAQHPLKRLFQYGRRYHGQIRWAIACSILNKIFDLAPPALIGAAVDVVVQKQNSWL
ncbi:MAG TPA: hypothetical protein V6D04_11985, partial [Candidatus Obscuribacterales bacterium]